MNFLKKLFGFNRVKENDMFNIQQVSSGRFGLFQGQKFLKSYARARDAKRGAARLGVELAA